MTMVSGISRTVVVFTLLTFSVFGAAIWSLSAGAVPVSWQVIANTLFDLDGPRQDYIILRSRLPRTLLALLSGGCLAISGTIVQALLRNPLASPKIIGINSGAALAVCLMVIALPDLPITYLPVAAVLGGCLAASLVWLGSEVGKVSPTRLVLIGIAVGFFCDAGVDYILVTSPSFKFSTPLVWLTGSLWARGWAHLGLVWHVLLLLAVTSVILSYRLDLIRLGDAHATGLGMNVPRERFVLLALAVLLAAISVSVVGVLGFVGLMAPHIARSLVGGSHPVLQPCAILTGMFLVVLADATGRALAPPVEISAGILTAMFGAPFFIFILITTGKAEQS